MKIKLELLALLLCACGATGCVNNTTRATRDMDILQSTLPSYPVSASEIYLANGGADIVLASSGFESQEERADHPLELMDAIRMSLQCSDIVRVREGTQVAASDVTFFDIQSNQAGVVEQLSAFDANFTASFESRNIQSAPDSFFGPGLVEDALERDELALNFGWTKRTTWGGSTSVLFNPNPSYLFIPELSNGSFNPRHVSELQFEFVQPLLRGAGRAFNLAPLEISQISVEQSAWDFKKTLMTSLKDIVTAYWDLYASQIALDAIDAILPPLDEVVRIQTEAYKSEWVTQTEVAKAKAQMFEFRRERESLRSNLLAAELRVRNLIGLPPNDGRELRAITAPIDQHLEFNAGAVLMNALDHQPDLVQRRLNVRLRMIEKRIAVNGHKPQLDAFARYRRNGVGDSLGNALDQMYTDDFFDVELGATLSVPLGRRQAKAAIRAADQRLFKETALLEQQLFSTNHNLQDNLRSIEYAFRQYQEAKQQVESAHDWVRGAKLRYQNPRIDEGIARGLITNLNEYLNALRFRTDAVTDKAAVLAEYNVELLRIEEQKGTLLQFFGIHFRGDPCQGSASLPLPMIDRFVSADADPEKSSADNNATSDSADKESAKADPSPARLPPLRTPEQQRPQGKVVNLPDGLRLGDWKLSAGPTFPIVPAKREESESGPKLQPAPPWSPALVGLAGSSAAPVNGLSRPRQNDDRVSRLPQTARLKQTPASPIPPPANDIWTNAEPLTGSTKTSATATLSRLPDPAERSPLGHLPVLLPPAAETAGHDPPEAWRVCRPR